MDQIYETLAVATAAGQPSCLVLFDGMGFARLGLLRAGYACVGVEIDPTQHMLAGVLMEHYGYRSPSVCADVLHLGLTPELISQFDAVWCSPPCQLRSLANSTGVAARPRLSRDLIRWSLGAEPKSPLVGYTGTLWVENVHNKHPDSSWGDRYNQVQFQLMPTQSRQRVIGGHFPAPLVMIPSQERYDHVAGVRPEESPVDGTVRFVPVPARCSGTPAPDPPGFARVLGHEVGSTVAARLRSELAPVRGLVPTLLATEGRSAPGKLQDRCPKINKRTGFTDDERALAARIAGGSDALGAVLAVLARERYYRFSSRGASRHYRRCITLREALCIMAVVDRPDQADAVATALEAARLPHTPPGKWTATLMHGLGNGVSPVMAEAFGRAALDVVVVETSWH